MELAQRLQTELKKYDRVSFDDYFDRCDSQSCYDIGTHCKCPSRLRDCLPAYEELDPSNPDRESAMRVVAGLFNLQFPITHVSSQIMEKGMNTKPIEIICEQDGKQYVAYAKKMGILQEYHRSLAALEVTRLLRGNIPYVFNGNYQVTANAGPDLDDTPLDACTDIGFAYQLGIDEVFRELIALQDIRPPNHCFNGHQVITIDLESSLNKFVPVEKSHEFAKYKFMHLLDTDAFNTGVRDGRRMIAHGIDENLEEFAKLVRMIESNHIDSMLALKKGWFSEDHAFSRYVLELLEEWDS